ncbi:MAG: phospho-sugar mutase [Polyangiaceae bacterium]|nr:phospho-sugar mutase [Polyangiaceae bacterium]
MTDLPEPEAAADPLLARARAWIDQDPDPETRAELEALVARGDLAELAERFRELDFGTAGLRGVVGAGPARMNRAVIRRATAAAAAHLHARVTDTRSLPVVLGFDARASSRAFAEEAAGVLVAAGIPVRYFPEPVPTPLVAYAARQLAANAAVVVTASHNPPEYNGYKLYGAGAVQVVPPEDTQIADRMRAGAGAASIPVAAGALSGEQALAEPVPASLFDRYLAELDALRPNVPRDHELAIVYTPLHGVGGRYVTQALRHAGFERVSAVAEQAEPDGAFPTVRFPNPEEPGALALAIAQAEREGAELILATDPDADRLAACVPTASGRWVQLTGNQIGLLLADFLLVHAPRAPRPLVVSSVVSSPMLGAVAEAHGARWERTLTGFKWIWTAALDLEAAGGVRYVFGYEEALGYSVGRLVRDKDGVSAAVLLAELAAHERVAKRSLLDRLADLYHRHGLWVSAQASATRPGAAGAAEIERAVAQIAGEPPASVRGRAVVATLDYRAGAESRPRWLGETPLLELSLEGGGRVLVRPSGTEPKLKVYVDLRVELAADASVAAAEEAALAEARAAAAEVLVAVGLGGA